MSRKGQGEFAIIAIVGVIIIMIFIALFVWIWSSTNTGTVDVVENVTNNQSSPPLVVVNSTASLEGLIPSSPVYSTEVELYEL